MEFIGEVCYFIFVFCFGIIVGIELKKMIDQDDDHPHGD